MVQRVRSGFDEETAISRESGIGKHDDDTWISLVVQRGKGLTHISLSLYS